MKLTVRHFVTHACCAAGLFLALAAPARALIIGIESFDYEDGPPAGKTGGQLWNWKNSDDAEGATRSPGTSDWDDVTAGSAIRAGRLITSNNSVKREYNGPGEGLPITTDEGKGAINNSENYALHIVYYRVTFTTGASLPAWLGVSSYDFGDERVFFGVPFGSGKFGIETPGNAAVLSTISVQPNTTYTLVTKLDYTTGQASLFVNPDLAAATEPAAAATVSFGTNWSTAVRLASGEPGEVAWDNLTVATLWSDFSPRIVTTELDEQDGSAIPTAGGGKGVSLREAVKYSPLGSTITFDPSLSGKTIKLTRPEGQLAIGLASTIDATALPGGITVDGNNSSRHFQVTTGKFLTLRGLTLTRGNGVGGGPALAGSILNQGTLLLDRCTLTANGGQGSAGAVYSDGPLRAVDSTFSGNMAAGGRGGVLNQISGAAELIRCTLSGNTAGDGGALWKDGPAPMLLSRCTVAGNFSNGNPSTRHAIVIVEGTLTLEHCTVTQNNGTGDGLGAGGGIYGGGSEATISVANSIIAGNSGPLGGKADISPALGNFQAIGTNLIGNNTGLGAKFPQGPFTGTAAAPLDPKLAPLGNYGGPTATMALLPGSPALNAATGSNTPGDQRGAPITGGPDLGAYETGGEKTVTTVMDEDNASLDPAAGGGKGGSLREAVKYSPLGSTITFAPALSGKTIDLTHADGRMTIPDSLTIDATALGGGLTVDGKNTSRHFDVPRGKYLSLRGLTLAGGNGAGGANFLGGSILSDGTLALDDCTLTGNVCPNNGGAIWSSGPLQALDCTFAENRVDGTGGALLLYYGNTTNLARCNISRNTSTVSGGAVYSLGTLRAADCTFADNKTNGVCGGILADSGTVELTRCALASNTASTSGVFYLGGTAAVTGTLSRCTVARNSTTGDFSCGGLVAASGTLTLQHCTVSQNTGKGAGGGLYCGQGAMVNLGNSIIAGNTDSASTRADIYREDQGILNVTGPCLIGNNGSVSTAFPKGPLAGTAEAPLDPGLSSPGDFGGTTRPWPCAPAAPPATPPATARLPGAPTSISVASPSAAPPTSGPTKPEIICFFTTTPGSGRPCPPPPAKPSTPPPSITMGTAPPTRPNGSWAPPPAIPPA